MAVKTLLELRTSVRQRSDMVYSAFVSDAELNGYINASAQELYDLLVEANVDYYTATQTFSISSGSSYSLPAAVYKLRGVDVELGGTWAVVRPFEWLERGMWQDAQVSRLVASVRYRILGNTLEFLPTDQASGSYRIRYVPFMTVLDDDADTFDGYNGFEEYVIVDAAIKAKDKEESSVSVLQTQKAALMKRIQAMSNTRDYAASDRVQDVRGQERANEWL